MIKIIKTYAVSNCSECPEIRATPEGPICPLTGEYVYPVGRTEIHEGCPYEEE